MSRWPLKMNCARYLIYLIAAKTFFQHEPWPLLIWHVPNVFLITLESVDKNQHCWNDVEPGLLVRPLPKYEPGQKFLFLALGSFGKCCSFLCLSMSKHFELLQANFYLICIIISIYVQSSKRFLKSTNCKLRLLWNEWLQSLLPKILWNSPNLA